MVKIEVSVYVGQVMRPAGQEIGSMVGEGFAEAVEGLQTYVQSLGDWTTYYNLYSA